MTDKRVAVDTSSKKGLLFKVTEFGGRYGVYRVSVGLLSDSLKRIGEARSLDDALAIIRSSVPGTVHDMRVSNW